ncbi:MAG: hybrid sensor histidine kinase/response regulator [Cyanobacteriota bacterium]
MSQEPHTPSKESILIVDDTPANLQLLAQMLSEQGYKIRIAQDGTMALMSIQSSPPDLILLDIMMPELNGYEVCSKLKASSQAKDIPIIFISALNEVFDKVKAFEVGGVDYITKPFQTQEVLARIEHQLHIRRLTQELSEQNALLQQEVHRREMAEAEVRQALSKEQELNQLKSYFVSMVSHEFRNPLTTILGFAELIRDFDQQLTSEKRQEYLRQIQESTRRMTVLLNDVLSIGQAEAGKLEFNPEPLDVEEFCGDLVEEMKLANSTQHRIVFSSPNQSTKACMDKNLLRQILTNLLSNAIKYSPKGSTVTFDLLCQDDLAIFHIKDQGIGISPEDQQRLFESFHRGSNVGKISGTGLGLTIVKKAVDLHGGQIGVNSELGVGTTFSVAIPLNRVC